MENKTEKLVLTATASYVGVIGYANVYKCQIAKIISGDLDETEITITILAGDKEKEAFMSSQLATMVFEMGCNKRKTNEPYSRMPISGFVDKDRTSWEIEYLMEASC